MASERDRTSIPPLAAATSSSKWVPEEIERDITEQIHRHASTWLSTQIRRVLVALGWTSAGVLGGLGGVLAFSDDDAPAAAGSPGSGPTPAATTSAGIPDSLLIPPADEHLLEACEQAGADARRAIRDARLCVDTFTLLRESCDPAAAFTRLPRRGEPEPTDP